mmetsp:Transcript_92939/g.194249  ORF Transcript_92939/g.194249 Transcript_92939/m.194249 type:complete len:458 (+) Transcript_92939:220-1593(+)
MTTLTQANPVFEEDLEAPDDEHLARVFAPPSSSDRTPGISGMLAQPPVLLPAPRSTPELPRSKSGPWSLLKCQAEAPTPEEEIVPPVFKEEIPPTIPGWSTNWTGNSPRSKSSSQLLKGLPARGAAPGKIESKGKPGSGKSSGFGCNNNQTAGEGQGQAAAPPPPKKPVEKCRTLKYFPPPQDDTDLVSVDVIDHGSEVLIVRRDLSPLRALTNSYFNDPANNVHTAAATNSSGSNGGSRSNSHSRNNHPSNGQNSANTNANTSYFHSNSNNANSAPAGDRQSNSASNSNNGAPASHHYTQNQNQQGQSHSSHQSQGQGPNSFTGGGALMASALSAGSAFSYASSSSGAMVPTAAAHHEANLVEALERANLMGNDNNSSSNNSNSHSSANGNVSAVAALRAMQANVDTNSEQGRMMPRPLISSSPEPGARPIGAEAQEHKARPLLGDHANPEFDASL